MARQKVTNLFGKIGNYLYEQGYKKILLKINLAENKILRLLIIKNN